METVHAFVQGLVVVALPVNLLLLVIGITVGMIIGTIPGISAASGIALLLPLTHTFGLAPESALILYAGVYYGSKYAGRIPAILLDIPGDVSSLATRFDGYSLAKAGQAGRALALTAVSSFVGGTLAIVVLILIGGLFAEVGNIFGPTEYVALIMFVFVLVLTLSAAPLLRTLTSLCLGLMMSVVGLDWATGVFRYTSTIPELYDGIDFIIVVIGVFTLSEAFLLVEQAVVDRKSPAVMKYHGLLAECLRLKWSFFRSSLVGTLIGLLPGAGTYVANLAAYRFEKKVARDKELFGKGDPRGLIGPEAANSACAFGAFFPLMALGIPGSATTAVLHGTLLLMNVDPGPDFCRNHPEIIWALIASMALGNILLLAANIKLARFFPKLLAVPGWVVMPLIVVVSFVSVYTVSPSMVSLLLMVIIGFFAYGLRKFHYPLAPLILGYVLGKPFEDNFRLALAISGGDGWVLLQSSTAVILWMCILLGILIKTAVIRKGR